MLACAQKARDRVVRAGRRTILGLLDDLARLVLRLQQLLDASVRLAMACVCDD
jgi:hypothetical protein